MGGILETGGASLALLGAVLAFEGCMLFEQQEVIDLAHNPYIYRSANYVGGEEGRVAERRKRQLPNRRIRPAGRRGEGAGGGAPKAPAFE